MKLSKSVTSSFWFLFVSLTQYKICSWLAIIFCAQSLANMRNFENDLKQISMAMMYVPSHSILLIKFSSVEAKDN